METKKVVHYTPEEYYEENMSLETREEIDKIREDIRERATAEEPLVDDLGGLIVVIWLIIGLLDLLA